MRHYDDGGTVAPPEWDDTKQNQLMQSLMPPGMQQGINTSSGGPSTPPAAGGTPPVPAPVSTPLKPPPEEADIDDNEKIADSHPGLQPGALDKYIQGQQQQVNEFGPEQQAALMNHINQGYKSPGMLAAKGGATLSDAIMQGVARAGTSGNLAAINEREQAEKGRAAEMGKSLQEQNLKGLETKQALEKQTAGTPLGASYAGPAKFLAKQLWPTASETQLAAIAQNPSALQGVLGPGVDLAKALADIANTAAYRQSTIAIQQATLENTKEHERTEEKLAGQQRQADAAKALAGRGIGQTIAAAIPGTAASAAAKALQGQLPGAAAGPTLPAQSFATEKDAEAANLPDGTPVIVGGVKGTWRNQ